MKKIFLTIAVLGALATTTMAQGAKKANTNNQPELTIEQKAERETIKATGMLALTDAQKVTFKKLATERFTTNKPIKDKAKASTDKTEKQALRKQLRENNEKFFTSVNSMLTPEQQTKWGDYKKKLMENKNKEAHQD